MDVKQQPGKEPHENKAEDILSELDAVLSELGAAALKPAVQSPEPIEELVKEQPAAPAKSGPMIIPFRSKKLLTPVLPAIAPSIQPKTIPGGAPPPVAGEIPSPEPEAAPVLEVSSEPAETAPEPAAEPQSEAAEIVHAQEVLPEVVEAAPVQEVSSEPAETAPGPAAEPVPQAPQEPAPAEGIPGDQIRNVFFFYSPGAEAVLEEFLKSLDNMALKVSKKPIYLKRAMVRPWDPGANTSLVIEAIKSSGASATVACLSAYNELQISAFEQALSRAGIFFRLVRAEEAGQRAVAVDLLVDLILIH